MRRGIFLGILWVLAATGPAAADSLEIAFNDNSAQAQYDHLLLQDEYGSSLINLRFLYNDREETTLGSLGFDFVGEPGNIPGLKIGVGATVNGGETDDSQDILTLGVGGRLSYAPPALGGVGLAAKVFYGPRIFAFLDAERMLETGARLGYAVTPRIALHVSYQNIRIDFDDRGDWTIDDAIRVGFTGTF